MASSALSHPEPTMLVIGVLQAQFEVSWSRSLKDKRRVVRGIKDRVRARYNVSVAECGDQEEWRTTTVGVVMAGSDTRFVASQMDMILDLLRAHPDAELVDSEVEIL